MRTSYFQIRLTPEERAELEAGADRFGTTVTGLIRKAVKAALTQRSILLPEERAAIDKALNELLLVYHAEDHQLIAAKIEQLNQTTMKLAENMMNTAVRGALKGTKI